MRSLDVAAEPLFGLTAGRLRPAAGDPSSRGFSPT